MKPEIAADIEMLVQYALGARMVRPKHAAEHVEAWLATYDPKAV